MIDLIPDVIGNLTALRTLDLSYNDISDISERDVLLPPLNLTNLRLSNNRLSYVPLNRILPLPNLRMLDLEENDIGVFDEKLTRIIQNGTVLRYSGKTGDVKLLNFIMPRTLAIKLPIRKIIVISCAVCYKRAVHSLFSG